MKGLSSFSQHFQLEVKVLKSVVKTMGEIQTASPWARGLDTGVTLDIYLQFISLLWYLPCTALGVELRQLRFEAGWTEVTNLLCFVHLKSCRVFADCEFGDLGCSCWFILPMASAVCAQGSVSCSKHAIISPVFPEWSSGLVWQQNPGNILRLSWSCPAGLNSFVSSIPVSSRANHSKKIIYALQYYSDDQG